MLFLCSAILLAGVLVFPNDPIGHEVTESRGLITEVDSEGKLIVLAGEKEQPHDYRWVTARDFSGEGGIDLSSYGSVVTTIGNRSLREIETMLWICGGNGWSSNGGFATIAPGESRELRASVWELYPDETRKLDPKKVERFQIMVRGAEADLELHIEPFRLEKTPQASYKRSLRMRFPTLSTGAPAPGQRVKFPADAEGAYSILYLPPSWKPEKKYPVVVEYPGNIFFNAKCYSTGRPEQCVIGYGMTGGSGSIILSLPFVDSSIPDVVESGFGDPDETVAYAKSMIETVIKDFGGDRENMVLTGFSRGSIACGFIGLRDDEIASYWIGIHGCQHYDGSKWRESKMEEAVLRAKRFRGKAIFQTDNSEEKYAPVVEATDPSVEWTWASSDLGFHSTSMFLDDRPSTRQLREWYRKLVGQEE